MNSGGTRNVGTAISIRFARSALLILACLTATVACVRSTPDLGPAPPPPPGPRTTLAPGDTIEVKFDYYPELSEQLLIRPDGKIALRRVGEVTAAGLEPKRLTEILTNAYQEKIKKPSLVVMVRQLAPMRVFVGGEVRQPGEVLFPAEKSRVNVLQAIIAAGGFINISARQSKILVVRYQGEQRYVTMLNLKDLTAEGKGSSEQFYLAENDIVYVTRLKIDKADQWVEQHINQIIPYGLHYTQTTGKRTYGYSTGY